MRLADLSWTDVRDRETELALLPVGSTEQHGPHAPLGTDCLTAEAVATAGAESYGEGYAEEHGDGRDADSHDGDSHDGDGRDDDGRDGDGPDDDRAGEPVVAPTIPVGVAEEHRAFPGTLWVTEETFRAYVRETIQSLAHHGLSRVVVVNGHGGNVAPLREVCARISRRGETYAVPFTWFDAVGVEELSADISDLPMGHGGAMETAFVRHLVPELVHEDRTEEAAAGASDRWGEWTRGVNLAYDADEFTDSGVVGDPREGDAALGEALLAAAAEALVNVLDAVAERER